MNRLAPAPADSSGEDDGHDDDGERYLLPKHAHLVVYERGADEADTGEDDESEAAGTGEAEEAEATGTDDADTADDRDRSGRQLVTIYDCGAAQKPPSAQLLGELGSVRAECETTRNPTGYVVSMRERAVLVDEGDDHWVVRPR